MTGVAVIGCGYWGKNLVRNFAELDALVAVSDRDTALASRFADEHGVPALSTEAVLADPDIPAVAIAAPAAQHFELARAALQQNKHVFVEKPLSLHASEAEELCERADEANSVLMVGHLLHYHPAFQKLQELVADGSLGRVQYLYSNRLNLGKIRREEDILWSFAPHDISMILALVGSEPYDVSAVGARYLHQSIADVTTTHLAFPGGERAHVFVSWLHPFKEQKLVVVGDRGMAVFDDGEPWETKIRLYRHHIDWHDGMPEPVRAESEPVPLEPAEPLRVECDHFLHCVAHGERPRTDGREGVRVLKVLEAAGRAMLAGDQRVGGAVDADAEAADDAPAGSFVHESSYVDGGAQVGEGTSIWHYCHVQPGARIGRNCTLGQNVLIGTGVTVGDGCKIQNNVSVYEGVELGEGVFCGPSCVFTNVVNPRSHVARKDEFQTTKVGQGATIGANATIVCGNTIGKYSMIGAGAVVTDDVLPHALMVGVPARRIGWVSHDGERLGDDLICPATGRQYGESGGHLVEEPTR